MVPRRNEQRLGSPEAATNSCDSAAWAGRCGESRRPPVWTARQLSGYLRAAGIPVRGRGRPGERAAKPAISEEVSTDSSLGKTGDWCAGVCPPTAEPRAHACAERQRLRAVSRADCRGAGARTQRGRDLARPGRRPRLLRAVRECPSLRRDTARQRRPPRRASSSRPRPAKKARSTTARRADGPRPRARGSTDARGSSS